MSRTNRKQQIAAWLCGAGIILCIAGYRGVTYLPKTAEEEMQDEFIRRMAPSHSGEVISHLDRIRTELMPGRTKPYLIEGRIALGLGAVLVVCGFVMWFQNTTPSQRFGWTRANDDV